MRGSMTCKCGLEKRWESNPKKYRQGKWSFRHWDDDGNLNGKGRLRPGVSGDDPDVQERIMWKWANGMGSVIFKWYLGGRHQFTSEY